jgi:glutathione S-transferase
MTNKPPNERELEKCYERWEQSIDDLENVWLTRSSYLGGDHLTIADLLGKSHKSKNQINNIIIFLYLGICELMQPIASGYNLNKEKFPRVYDWMERVKKETQPFFNQAHAIPMRMREGILKNEKSKL